MVKKCKNKWCETKNYNGAKKCKGCGDSFISNKMKKWKETIKKKIKGEK